MIFSDQADFSYNEKAGELMAVCSSYIKEYAELQYQFSTSQDDEILYKIGRIISDILKQPHHLYKVINIHENKSCVEIYEPTYYSEAYEILASEVIMWSSYNRLDLRLK
ncbi:hypothetical protein 65p346 [Aeromonas phage 65]|uniref:Uncharacterized protein n=2 Tax=Ishigurovirus osborne TaxID=260149 RepID=A0A219YCH0_9CAUD|nr:hypothetical protein ST65p346 [Aeromonas phage 65]ADQ53354.1 hypothetical protein 65p346 [Aeromonas phage 65]APU01714.1 hypothetical protein [Aeromonas phage 65.2]